MHRSLNSLFALGLLLAVLVCTTSAPAAGQSVYSTKFEDPPFVVGPLNGQDCWIAPVPFLSPNAAVISTEKPRQGQQSVRVLGEDLEHEDLIHALTNGYYDAIGSYRKPVNFDTQGIVRVRISAHVRVDGPTTPGTNFFSAALVAVAVGGVGVGQLDISSEGIVIANTGDNLVPVPLASGPITLGEWHALAIVDDFGAQTFTLSVDDQSLGTYPFPAGVHSTVLSRGSLLALTAPDTGSRHKADYTAHYDNFSISVVGKDDE